MLDGLELLSGSLAGIGLVEELVLDAASLDGEAAEELSVDLSELVDDEAEEEAKGEGAAEEEDGGAAEEEGVWDGLDVS